MKKLLILFIAVMAASCATVKHKSRDIVITGISSRAVNDRLDSINTGTGANTGTGDPLRTMAIKTNVAINTLDSLFTEGLRYGYFKGSTSGKTQIRASAVAGTTVTTLPSTTGTLIVSADTATMLNKYPRKASPTFTGVVTVPTPFTLGATSVTSTGTQLNYLSGATGTTGTGNVVLSAAPTFSGTVTSGGNIALGANSITMTGSLGETGSRVTKGWFTDVEVTDTIVAAKGKFTDLEVSNSVDIATVAVLIVDSTGYEAGNYMPRYATEQLIADTLAANRASATPLETVAIMGKMVKKTIGLWSNGGFDTYFDTTAADHAAQNLNLGAIIPAKARVIAIEIVCTTTLTSSAGAADITMRAGNASAGEQFIASLSCDDANEVVGIINPALPQAVVMNWAAATSIYIGGDPDQNWNTMTAGQWSVYVTYINYEDI